MAQSNKYNFYLNLNYFGSRFYFLKTCSLCPPAPTLPQAVQPLFLFPAIQKTITCFSCPILSLSSQVLESDRLNLYLTPKTSELCDLGHTLPHFPYLTTLIGLLPGLNDLVVSAPSPGSPLLGLTVYIDDRPVCLGLAIPYL